MPTRHSGVYYIPTEGFYAEGKSAVEIRNAIEELFCLNRAATRIAKNSCAVALIRGLKNEQRAFLKLKLKRKERRRAWNNCVCVEIANFVVRKINHPPRNECSDYRTGEHVGEIMFVRTDAHDTGERGRDIHAPYLGIAQAFALKPFEHAMMKRSRSKYHGGVAGEKRNIRALGVAVAIKRRGKIFIRHPRPLTIAEKFRELCNQ